MVLLHLLHPLRPSFGALRAKRTGPWGKLSSAANATSVCMLVGAYSPSGQRLNRLHVFEGSCGVSVDKSAVESWLCELCNNEKTQEASLVIFFSDFFLGPLAYLEVVRIRIVRSVLAGNRRRL
jgi:hypothetical protein